MKSLHKEYQHAFLLEPTKLERLVNTIHERLADHADAVIQDNFEIFLTADRSVEVGSLDEALALENSKRHKIWRVVVLSSAAIDGRREHEVQVDFGRMAKGGESSGSGSTMVRLNVRSDRSGWASRTLSEVEEQVERTWAPVPNLPTVVALAIGAVLILLASQFVSTKPEAPGAGHMWLQDSDVLHVNSLLSRDSILTSDDLREIATIQLRNVRDAVQGRTARPRRTLDKGRVRGSLLAAVPLAVALACTIALLTTCYPTAVFLWGDEVRRYQAVEQRRKRLWEIVLGITAIGVLAGLLVAGLSSFLERIL